MRKSLLLFFFVLSFGAINAQDIHFTMFDLAPLRMNPANTGAYLGSFRIGGIYRGQWNGMSVFNNGNATISSKGYKTPAVYIDAPFLPFANRKCWLGGGLSFYQDNAGIGNIKTLNAQLSLAAHIGLGAKGNTVLSLGFSGGLYNSSIGGSGLLFAQDILNTPSGGTPTSGSEILDNANVSTPDFSAGLKLSHQGANGFKISAGFSMNHITQPSVGFFANDEFKLPYGFIGNFSADIPFGESKLYLRPMAFYQTMAKAQEINAQALLGYFLNEDRDMAILFGGGYRVNDAALLRIGAEIKGFNFGFAYDLNMSGLSNNSRAQGFEVGASYIAKVFKDPNVPQILFCPRF
jgi:type IX secretion system PorP/SprF family membrane protein